MATAGGHEAETATGKSTAVCTDGRRICLTCSVCAGRCAIDARFCARCGVKLKHNTSTALRTTLPTLTRLRPSTVVIVKNEPRVIPRRESPTRSGSPQTRQTTKKRPHPGAKKPLKLVSLDSTAVPEATLLTIDSTSPPRTLHAPTRTGDMEFRLKTWMASTRRLLESVLELKRRVERPEFDALDGAHFQSIDHILCALQLDLDELEPYFALDRNVQAKCVAMLEKLKFLHSDTQKQLQNSIDMMRASQTTQPPSCQQSHTHFEDAEISIRASDGRRMYFKARHKLTKAASADPTPSLTPISAMIVPHHHSYRHLGQSGDKSCEDEHETELSKPRTRITQFIQARWPSLLLVRVTRLDGRAILLRVSENNVLNQLIVDVYRPLPSSHSTLNIPFEWLAFILPPTITWFRASEVRRCKAVEAHWSRCFDHVVKCLHWRSHSHDLDMYFPIQFRQARMFSFRSFAIFYGLLTVHLIPPDYSLRLHFFNVSTCQCMTLHLPVRALTTCLGSDYQERIIGTTTRRTFYAQVCEKLYFEYTSRGFELLFPGVKPKGAIRRHPSEISVSLHRDEQLAKEHRELKAVMQLCIQQAVIVARRRLEQYQERVRRLKEEKREAAAKKIQSQTRSLIAKRKRRQERDDKQRTSRVQDLAAVLIQQQYRKRRDAERHRRARELQRHATCGTRFRVCTRVNGAHILVLVHLDIIDAPADVFDCNVSVVHASTSQTAHLRVPHAELQRLTKQGSSHRPQTRRELVESLVRQHLDVFRSAKHNVLVLELVQV